MLGMLAVAMLSVCVSLSLCVVPVLARYTVFPLLSGLIHKFAAAYLTDSIQVEYTFGSFAVRARRGVGAASEQLRGITISLFFVKLQSAFLKTLAFTKQGLAPVELKSVSIKKITIHLATTWKVVVKVEGVAVDGHMVDPNVEGVFELQDAVAMKLTEAANWMNLLVTERTTSELRQKQAEELANTPSKSFSFKDRVLQQIAAQVDVHVSDVRVAITGLTPGAAAIDGHDDEAEEKDDEDQRWPPPAQFLWCSSPRVDEALQLVLTSEAILVEYAMSIKGISICAATVDEGEDDNSAVERKQDPLKDNGELVPPMPRLLGIVENIAPIPMKNRLAQVELASSSINNISVTRELLVGVLRDLFVPYTDHQVLVQSVRTLEHDETVPAKSDDWVGQSHGDALRWENMSIWFVERGRQVAEMVVIGFGVNVRMFTITEGDEKQKLDVDLVLGQTTFVVNVGTSVLNPVSPTAKLLFADFSKVAAESDVITPPQMLTAHVSQFESGKQDVRAAVNNVKLVLSAYALEHFLLYVDRLSTKTTQVLSTSRPPTTPIVHSESSPAPVQVAKSEVDTVTKEVSMSPFSLLGGMLLNLDVNMNDCHILLLPTQSFSKSLFTDINVETWQSEYVVNCRVDMPATLSIHLESSKVKEMMEFNVQSFSIGAQYFTLAQDAKEPLICHQSVMMHMPDVLVAGSDLSLSLLASCSEALGSVQTTTPDQARLRLESRMKQDEIRRQAEVDAVLDRLHRLFNEIDENGNGRIELAELLLLLRRVKVGDTLLESELEHFVRELFKEIDQDGNGFLEFQELRAFLRDDLLSDEAAETADSKSANGSNALSGFLNLRGNEYHSFEVVNKLCDTKITSTEQLAEWIRRPAFEGRFWELFESEARVTNRSMGDQNPLDVQKKLVRLLKNYDAANLIWDALVLPAMKDSSTDLVMCEWLLQPFTRCGGISEYQSAAKVIAKKKRDGIFSAALEEAEHLVSKLAQEANPVKKALQFTTDVKMGNLRFVLTDTGLPARFCRGDFVIKEVKMSMELTGKEIDEVGPVDWLGLATSGNSDWTILFGFKMSSSCYSDIANDMENIIEPWDLVAGISSGAGENGFSTYRALMDALDGEAQQNALQKHQDSFQSTAAAKKHKETDCLVQNFTGCKVTLKLNGSDEEVVVDAHNRAHIENGALKDGVATLDSLEIDQWGASTTAVKLPSFGNVSVGVSTAEASPSTVFVTVFSRLENPRRQLIVLRSNTYFCNHSSECYEVKYLSLASEGRKAVESPVIKLRPNERISLPLSLLMGITEFYARPENYEHWIVKTSLNNDVLTSTEAIKELEVHEAEREVKKKQRRGGTIVYGETEETCTKVVKSLTPNMIVRRWHLRSHFEWELALLPPFVVRNSLPYEMEYRFIEYKTSSSRDMKTEYAKVEALLRRESALEPVDGVLTGVVESGHDTEVSGVSGDTLAIYLFDWLPRSTHTGKHIASPWSKPLLMMIHKGVEQFTTSRENVEADTGLKFNIDRITLPGYPRLVHFSSPYWIVDNTSLAFDFASTEQGAKRSSFKALDVCAPFSYPIMTSLRHDRLSLKPRANLNRRPEAWGELGNMPQTAYKASAVSEHAIKNAQWSEPINTTAINTMGEIVCGPSVFSVQMEGLYGLFEPGVSLTLSPRYFVQNRLNQKLYIQSFASHDNDPQKVDDMFHKRSVEDKGESVEQSQRYVSFSFSEDWGTDGDKKNWSFAIPINTAGDLYLQVYSSVRQRYLICQASVQVVDMYVYVVLTDVSCAPPYRIENYTPFTVDCAQLGESSIFSSGQKEMAATIKSAQTKKYDIDYVGYLDPVTMWVSRDGEKQHPVELTVQVVVEESTRVLKIAEKELELSLLESQDSEGEGTSSTGGCLFFSSVDVIKVQKAPASLEWTFSVLHCQVDNMLATAKFPVIMNPVNAGYSDKSVGKEPEPFLKLVLDADLEARMGTYKLLEFSLSDLAVKVDIDYLVNLVKLLEPADIIGNPIGLVEDLGSGVVEFLKITKGELTGDAQTRGEGVKVLGKTIVKSGASSVAKITGSLDKFVGEFSDDKPDPSGDDSSTDNVGIKFAKDLGRGFTGIFTKPVEGAMKGGVTGLVQGTVQGIAGPGVVLLKGLTSTSHNLALVLGANGLDSDKSCDPLCVVRIDGVDVMKTAVIYNTVNPVWQEKTQVALTGEESEVQFVVKDSYGGTVAKTVGKCIMSMAKLQEDFKPPEYSSDLAQWVHTQVKPGNTKKNVSHVITEKEYPLVMLKKNSSKKANHAASFGDEKHQVLVTVVSLRDMVVTSSTGGGVLGLGNLGSSTPNISPYISVHVGKNANRTNIAKMSFTKSKKEQFGNATWGESFTFPLTAKELHRSGADSRLVVYLKDKSMLVDTRLGSATLEIDATRINVPASTEEMVLKDQSGKPIGYLTVKVEVTGSATSSRSLSIQSLVSAGDDIANLPPDAVKAGTIRVSCGFEGRASLITVRAMALALLVLTLCFVLSGGLRRLDVHGKNIAANVWEYDVSILHNAAPTAVDSMSFEVLQYNLFGRPYEVSKDGQSERLQRVPESLHRISETIDVVTFAEADIQTQRDEMLDQFRNFGFNYSTTILHDPDPFTSLLNGGVMVVSKWPIIREAQHVYRNACHYSDCLAAKGVKYARLLKNVDGICKIFNVFATHMQAWSTPAGRSDRIQQAKQMRQFIDAIGIPHHEPLILAGDFNVDNHTFGDEVAHLVELLEAHEPRQIGEQAFTSDPHTNVLVGRDGAAISNKCSAQYVTNWGPPKPSSVPTLEAHVNQVKHFTVDWTAPQSNMKMALVDLSDHYPVHGKFEFAVTRGKGKDDDPLTYHLDGCSTDDDCHFRNFRCYCNGPNCFYKGNHTNGWDLDSEHPVNHNCLYQKTSFRCLCGPT
ncbi:Vacuolar protein sorting-associated protein 13, C-terminal [Phytophthora cactorum]|nr:Vacuolar protein sorting-associated protein 13, C-terminal [Phytophthora cactorum]